MAAFKPTIQFVGDKELMDAFGQLSARMTKRIMGDALEAAAEPMRRRMAQLAPREPGAPDLAQNFVISRAKVPRGSSKDTAAVAVGPTQEFFYGFFQEYGTAFHGAQPFMRPSFDQGVPRVITDLARAMWVELAARGVSQTVSAPSGPLT